MYAHLTMIYLGYDDLDAVKMILDSVEIERRLGDRVSAAISVFAAGDPLVQITSLHESLAEIGVSRERMSNDDAFQALLGKLLTGVRQPLAHSLIELHSLAGPDGTTETGQRWRMQSTFQPKTAAGRLEVVGLLTSRETKALRSVGTVVAGEGSGNVVLQAFATDLAAMDRGRQATLRDPGYLKTQEAVGDLIFRPPLQDIFEIISPFN